jgi:hypothetical protein
MTGIGQNQSLAGASRNVRFGIRKWASELIAAVQNDLYVGSVGFAISERN